MSFRARLEALEVIWREQRAPIASALSPGLSSEDIDSLARSADLVLPDEARTWWAWHNGVAKEKPPVAHTMILPWIFLPLEHSLDLNAKYRREWPPHPEQFSWPGHWIPIADSDTGFVICITAGNDRRELAPVTVFSWHDDPQAPPPTAPSMDEMVQTWLRVLGSGASGFSDERGQWFRDWDNFPEDLRRNRLV